MNRSRRLPTGAAAWIGVLMLSGWLAACAAPAKLDSQAVAAKDESAVELQRQTRALARASSAMVGLRSIAVADALSNRSLGRRRQGSGVLIDDDGSLVLTVGYLVLEAEQIEIELDDGRVFPGRVAAYDPASGFGLVKALAPLPRPASPFGESAQLSPDQPLMIASGGAAGDLSVAWLASRRPFTGAWEYHVDDALFTIPAREDFSGAALFNADGELLGIGALIVKDARGPGRPPQSGNMFIPVDMLRPILAELRESGSSAASRRAWLGVNCVESKGQVRVTRITTDGPADAAGMLPGDQIIGIDGAAVSDLPMFYKTLWQGNTPNREVLLQIRRDDTVLTVKVQATDRRNSLRRAQGI